MHLPLWDTCCCTCVYSGRSVAHGEGSTRFRHLFKTIKLPNHQYGYPFFITVTNTFKLAPIMSVAGQKGISSEIAWSMDGEYSVHVCCTHTDLRFAFGVDFRIPPNRNRFQQSYLHIYHCFNTELTRRGKSGFTPFQRREMHTKLSP